MVLLGRRLEQMGDKASRQPPAIGFETHLRSAAAVSDRDGIADRVPVGFESEARPRRNLDRDRFDRVDQH